MELDWQFEASLAGRAIVASLLGAAIGWERERTGHDAGLRTCATVAMGSCVFGLVSQHGGGGDPTRIAAQVVTGIGFLGAGIILRDQGKVKGLTTAASIWAVAAIGLAVAYHAFLLAGLCTIILFTLLRIQRVPGYELLVEKKEREKTKTPAASEAKPPEDPKSC